MYLYVSRDHYCSVGIKKRLEKAFHRKKYYNKKLKKHYYVISLDDTIKEWPDFLDSLESRFAWFKINL